MDTANKTAKNMFTDNANIITPEWDFAQVTAFTTTKQYEIQNLQQLNLEYIDQVHQAKVIKNTQAISIDGFEADAVYSFEANTPCVIRTADCLPILLYSKAPQAVAAIHGGWRSLAAGIIDNTLEAMAINNSELYAWLGPCISQQDFEVGADVYQAFCQYSPNLEHAFNKIETEQPLAEQKYLADLPAIARYQLERLGVKFISQYQGCTYQESERFYSFRRAKDTGRMHSVIYFE